MIRPSLYYDPSDESAVALALHVETEARKLGLTQISRVPMLALVCERPLLTLPLPLGPSNTGLDLSHWNNNDTPLSKAQFNLVKAQGHKFVWIKRSQGLFFVDKNGLMNFTAASEAGELWIGNMHFFEWDVDGTEQIDHFSRTCGEAIGNFYELLDVELESGDVVTDKLKAEANLRKALARSEMRFLRKPVIYTSRNYWQAMFIPSRVMDILRDYMFLIADWDGPLDQEPVGLSWVHFRQKSATYKITGIAGDLDLDEYRGLPPPPGTNHTLNHLTNQLVINLFDRAFGRVLVDGAPFYIIKITQATDEAAVFGNRTALFVGPAIELMPGLTDDEKNKLISVL